MSSSFVLEQLRARKINRYCTVIQVYIATMPLADKNNMSVIVSVTLATPLTCIIISHSRWTFKFFLYKSIG